MCGGETNRSFKVCGGRDQSIVQGMWGRDQSIVHGVCVGFSSLILNEFRQFWYEMNFAGLRNTLNGQITVLSINNEI